MQLHSAACLGILAMGCALSGHADTVYNEAIQGDLSNSGLTPTAITIAVGSNQILGTTGSSGTGIDRDYFTITVPSGLKLTALIELAGTSVGGVSFIGLQAGNQFTLPTNAVTANGLLGWTHYGPAATDRDILSAMSVPSNGSSGFTTPLNAGSYSFWIQDFNTGRFSYGFNVVLAPAPEPKAYALMLAGFAALILLAKQRKRSLTNLLHQPHNSSSDLA